MRTHQKLGPGLICLALLITLAIFVVAGYMESTPGKQDIATATPHALNKNPAAGVPVTARASSVPVTTDPAVKPTSLITPQAPFIAIDPIGDKNTGDLIVISGTTNLPPRTSIYLKEINESTGESTMRANNVACPDPGKMIRWVFVLESTVWMKPGSHSYTVSTPKGDVTSSVRFTLNGRFPGPQKIQYYESGSRAVTISGTGAPFIQVDPIGDHQKGDIFFISGTTNLIEGTMLQCTVWPIYVDDRSKRPAVITNDPCDGQWFMTGHPAAVVKGSGNTNRWSFPADMTNAGKTEMNVHISTTDELFTKREILGNASFNLK